MQLLQKRLSVSWDISKTYLMVTDNGGRVFQYQHKFYTIKNGRSNSGEAYVFRLIIGGHDHNYRWFHPEIEHLDITAVPFITQPNSSNNQNTDDLTASENEGIYLLLFPGGEDDNYIPVLNPYEIWENFILLHNILAINPGDLTENFEGVGDGIISMNAIFLTRPVMIKRLGALEGGKLYYDSAKRQLILINGKEKEVLGPIIKPKTLTPLINDKRDQKTPQ